MNKIFCRCACFFKSNIYLKPLAVHVHFTNDELFRTDYQNLETKEYPMERILMMVHEEIERRQNLDQQAQQRKEQIQQEYQPLHRDLYGFESSFFCEEFKELCLKPNRNQQCVKNYGNGIYSFPVLTKDFCRRMIEELKHFEASSMPKGRPNTMNHYGVLLDELGFTSFMDQFRMEYLNPLARAFFGDEFVGHSGLDSHRAFVVSYKIGEDVDLDYHYDNAEVTLNISLNDEFEGGDLYFGSMAKATRTVFSNFTFIPHRSAFGVLHRGQHLHGTESITSGERYNLIIWLRSSSIRNEHCPMCWQKPVELLPITAGESTGDGMTRTLDKCSIDCM